ncbi:hypothetical protein K1Y78_28530 [Streptomyces sp. tea 10]|nr:hypothetical protein [Streptomyces sp. tea 10]
MRRGPPTARPRPRPRTGIPLILRFDLRTGTVSGSETAWSAGTDAGGDGNGAFEQAPPGSTFCLRDTTNGDIAVITVTDVDHGNYATTDDITYYRHRS